MLATVSRLARFKRWAPWLAALLLVCALAWPVLRWLRAEHSISAAGLRFAATQTGSIVREASDYARAVAARSPTLFAESSGVVIFQAEAGSAVAAGAELATISSPELQSRLKQEQSTYESLQAEVASQRIANERAALSKQRELDAAQIAATAALREWQRAEKAFAVQAMSAVDHLRAKDALDAAQLSVDLAKKDLQLERKSLALELQNRTSVAQRQRLIGEELERQIAALTLRAPFAGVVGSRLVADRSSVAANTGVLTLVDLSGLELELRLAEIYADALTPGLTATITHQGQEFEGTVRTVSPEVSEGQISARVQFSGAVPADLKQSQRLLTKIQFERRDNTLTVARGSFVDGEQGRFAWVQMGQELVRTPITLGLMATDKVEVLQGLKAGQNVLLSDVPGRPTGNRILLR